MSCHSSYKHCLANQNATESRPLSSSMLHHEMQTLNAHIKETTSFVADTKFDSMQKSIKYMVTRNGIVELSQSPEARTVRGFCGFCISSYGMGNRSWISIIFLHFHSSPGCTEKGLIQPHDSCVPFSRICRRDTSWGNRRMGFGGKRSFLFTATSSG